MFNVRVKRFRDVEQVQFFKQPIRENFDDRKCDPFTGEILGVGQLVREPFTNELAIIKNPADPEQNMLRSMRRTIGKVYDIARSNDWDWFFTLTFNPEKVNSFDYSETSKRLTAWLNNMRKKNPDMIYLVVPEQHKSGRWHFHGLFANVDNLNFLDSGKRDKKGRTIFNVGDYRLGWSTATVITDLDRACSYVTKYLTKELCSITSGRKRYWVSQNVKYPEIETYFVGMSEKEILELAKDKTYVKQIANAHTDIVYIDAPIHSVDTSVFIQNSLKYLGDFEHDGTTSI